MRKIVFVSSLLVMLASISALASDTRVTTMGNNNMILLDEANIFLFPSRLMDWPNLTTGEFASDGFSRLGVHWKFGSSDKPWYLATYLHNSTAEEPALGSSPFFTEPFGLGMNFGFDTRFIPFDDALLPNKRIDIFYGREWGGSNFGFHFGNVHSSSRQNAPAEGLPNDAKDKESYGSYTFDFSYTMNDGLLDLAVGIDFISFTDQGTDSLGAAYHETKSKGNNKLHFLGRSFYEYSPTYTFIPHVAIGYAKHEAEYFVNGFPDSNFIALAETNKYTQTTFDLGVGMQYVPATNVIAVLDFGFRYDRLKGEFIPASGATSEASLKTTSFPYLKVGFDADVFSWMDIRFGATTFWQSVTTKNISANGEHINRFPDNETFVGFGFHWNRLHIDTRTSPQLFLRGFDFINGKSHNDDMNAQLSVVYEMM